ncbi:hypothetical protein Pint_29008 [Pistacia integerrima]|uniref:Uncharacterized protein n=1 Tax=Pistacia integerrima TaxID=434235 RepID=A0ACC0WYY9_9ROSI|nr:hypothetical protein Pint_29008 [Pistacia integerrima]
MTVFMILCVVVLLFCGFVGTHKAESTAEDTDILAMGEVDQSSLSAVAEWISITVKLWCISWTDATIRKILVSDLGILHPAFKKKGEYVLIRDAEDGQLDIYDKPLPCFGCGIGWFSLLLGFVFPFMWYYATILYFGNYYHKDPRERSGLAASAIAVSFDMYNSCGDHYRNSYIINLPATPLSRLTPRCFLGNKAGNW